jgi:hypothetical protein
VIVHLSPATPAELTDLDRLDRLHAECDGAVGNARLAGWCRLDDDGEHLWLDIAACRELGAAVGGERWVEQYDAMIGYASSQGWTNDAGTHVRAHIEPTGA